jgi:tetratricopeptide (TPR) repeat protein
MKYRTAHFLVNCLFALTFLSQIPMFLIAQDYKNYETYTESELRSLPKLVELKLRCHLTQYLPQGCTDDSEMHRVVVEYIKKYGYGFNGLHHYGKGLIYMQRVKRLPMDPDFRDSLIKLSIGEFSFILKEPGYLSNREFQLDFGCHIFYARGDAYLTMGNFAQAARDFISAIKLHPSFPDAYLGLSECYKRLGNEEKAKEVLELLKSRVSKGK